MNTILVSRRQRFFAILSASIPAIGLALLPAITRADVGLQVGIAPPGISNEFNRGAFLTWQAEAGSVYRVQSSTNIGDPAAWVTEDAVSQAGAGPIKWMAPESLHDRKYYRLILPQPQIFSVEPAIVPPSVPVDVYILGQSLGTNVVLQINGVTQGGTVYQSSTTLIQPSFTPDVPGSYQFSIVVGGAVVSSFTVVCADPLSNPELVLQGPPAMPVAAPVALWLSKKGYDYYQASSDMAAARAANNPYFKGNANAGEMPADYRARRGYDKYKELATSADSFDIEQARNIGSQSSGVGAGKVAAVTIKRMADSASPFFFRDSCPPAGGGGGGIYADKYGRVKVHFYWDRTGSQDADAADDADDVDTLLMPALMKAKEKANQTKCGNNLRVIGVSPFSGEVEECDVDLAVPGVGLDFIWARTYHSRIGRSGSSSNGWTFSYDVRCAHNSNGGLDVYDGTGRKDTFAPGANGIYTCPEFFSEGAISNTTFTLTFADTGKWLFNPLDGTAAAGKLAQIVDRNGNTMSLGYDSSGRLVQVVDDLGRTNIMSYNPSGQLASVTDFSGRTVTYQYYAGAKSDNGNAGDLMSVTSPPVTGTPNGNDFPAGKTTTYTYSKSFPLDRENHLLLTVMDPKGQAAAVFFYEHSAASPNYLRCISAQRGLNQSFTYNWTIVSRPAGSSAVMKCFVNDPVGNVSECFFDARGRCVLEDDYTGRATPGVPVTGTVNRPTGQLRADDPAYFETAWSWNNDSLCSRVLLAGGQDVRCVYQSDFDPSTSARKRADCRVVREFAASAVDLDGDGVADISDRAWHFQYDPRFGSLRRGGWFKTVVDGKVDRKSISVIFHNDAGEETGRHAINTKGAGGASRAAIGMSKSFYSWMKASYDRCLAQPPGSHAPLDNPSAVDHAVNTKGTGAQSGRAGTKTQGDFNLSNRFSVEMEFVTSATDPRGLVTTAGYDAKGNPAQITISTSSCGANRPTVSFTHNSQGQLTAVTNLPDANCARRVDIFNYNTSGPQAGHLQSCVIDAAGLALTSAFECDARGNLTRVIDPRANDWLFTYNALDQCVQTQSALLAGSGSSWRVTSQCAFDANDNLVQCATELRDAAGALQGMRTDNYQFDGADRLSQCALAVDAIRALTNRFIYDGNNQCVQVLDGDAVSGADPHRTVTCQYDERCLPFLVTNAPGSSAELAVQFNYTPNGLAKSVQWEPHKAPGLDSPEIDYTYDGFDRPATITDPMGNQTFCYHDAIDNLKVARHYGELNDVPGSAGNVRLAETHYQYDGLDRCVQAQDLFFNPATQASIGSGQSVTTWAFAPNGECTSVTDALGHPTTFGYDTACRPVSVTDALGNQSSAAYDACGNPLVVISSEIPAVGGKVQVFAVTNGYDAFNRCVSVTDSAGNAGSCAYDSLSRCVQTIDPRGVQAFYSYDLLDRCTLAIGDLDQDGLPDFTGDVTTTWTWSSSSGDLLAVTDSNTNTTSYAYDSMGRCLGVTRPDGTREQLIWSPRSNLIFVQDANGTTVSNTYNLRNGIVHRDIACRNVLATTTFETFTYDGCGRLTGHANDACSGAFTYDSLGNCVSDSINSLATTSTYDACGNRLSLTYPGGRSLACTYDALNRCATISDSGQQLASYSYDGPDRISRINLGNGTRSQFVYDGFSGTPNPQGDHGFGQLSRVRHGVVASGATIDDRTFGYDAAQNKTSRNMPPPFTLGGAAQSMSFQYDPECRLTGTLVTTNGSVARATVYVLDRMGNRASVSGAACSGAYTLSSALPPGDFQMNQYTATPCDSRGYDDNGNLVNRSSPVAGQTSYQYDYADRLVQAQSVDFSTGVPVTTAATYGYDALGRRISKSVSVGGLPPVATQFGYDGDCVIEERNGSTTMATYVKPPRCFGAGQPHPQSCLTMRLGTQDFYVHTDDQDNTLALTDSTGVVVERYDYDDYGAVSFLTSDGFPTTATSSSVGNVYLWGGRRLDSETGLHNDDGGGYLEPLTGRAIRGKVKDVKYDGMGRVGDGNNPWSVAPPSDSDRHLRDKVEAVLFDGGDGGAMQKQGSVKFFNNPKGFGAAARPRNKTGHVTLMK